MLRLCFLICLVFVVVAPLKKCFDQKCKTTKWDYVYCDQEDSKCTLYDTWNEIDGSCVYLGYAHYSSNHIYCDDDKKCGSFSLTGTATCDIDWDDYNSVSNTTIIIIVVTCSVVGISIISCICCACLKKGCFKNRAAGGGRVITQPVTYNQSAGTVQTSNAPPSPNPATTHPTAQYPPAQYPPAQYPPVQYPPQQYPPAQYPHAQYPPAQYPSAQYPPAQYPPAGGYPSAPVGDLPAGNIFYNTQAPPSYESSTTPAINPAFRK